MAAAVNGLDLNRLPDRTTRAALLDLLHDNLVLCIRGQTLAPPAFRDAMAQFGTPMLRKQLARTADCAEVSIISSEDRDELGDGRKIVNGANWHTDDSFMREPCSLTMLYGVVVPSRGGDTQFTNMYRHVWRQGDIVIWDNRCTMHKANADYPEGERRLMHRVIAAGTVPS